MTEQNADDKVECRHHGGTEDCPPTCWLLYGDRFIAATALVAPSRVQGEEQR